ncbi:MAG TPA: alpha-hydroxy acid oxidase [Methylomirabilota bacterium]|jgi:(S)-mandelate dehydrogenase|nr:alpha-hydroxy acid oxidase [Methylomirabilota bacterium]
MSLGTAINIADLRARARRRLPRVVFDYLDGGAEDETTLDGNRAAFRRWVLVPRVLPGTGSVDLSVELFGDRLPLPLIVGPTGLNGLFRRHADVLLARATGAAGAVFTLSTASNSSLEDVAATGPGIKWFQLYPWGERSLAQRLLERAAAAGYRVLVVTVDGLTIGKRERDLRHGFAHEVHYTPTVVLDGLAHPRWLIGVWLRGGVPRFENIAEFAPKNASARELTAFVRAQHNRSFSWGDLAWLRGRWRGPFLIKGLLAVEDATRAADLGADGVIVSNHGGRQLDGAIASLDALVPIVDAIGRRVVVIVDGGVRRGAEVVKALALGARAVLLGRAPLYGLAVAGEPGVARALAILREEMERAMFLLGCPSVAALSRASVRERGPRG